MTLRRAFLETRDLGSCEFSGGRGGESENKWTQLIAF